MLPFLCGKNTAEEQALCREVQEAVESGRVTAELREKLGLPGNERVAAGLLRTWAQDGTIARLIEDVQAGQVRGELERRGEWSNGENFEYENRNQKISNEEVEGETNHDIIDMIDEPPKVLFEYIQPEELEKITTEPNTAYFWSGTTNGIGGKKFAIELANANKGKSLEMLVERYNINMPDWDMDDPSTIRAWEELSKEYAKRASGEIRAIIGSSLRKGNVWENIELPTLKRNPKVTKIIVMDPETRREKIIFERK